MIDQRTKPSWDRIGTAHALRVGESAAPFSALRWKSESVDRVNETFIVELLRN